MSIPIERAGLYAMSDEDYHADPAPEPSLSRGAICDLLYYSPRHCWEHHPRLNPVWQPEHDRKFDLGSAAHDALLCGMGRVVPVGFKDWRARGAREARRNAITEGKLPVLVDQYDDIKLMVETAKAYWAESLQSAGIDFSQGMTELSALWQEDAGTWCRARFDWLANDRSLLVDYKSTLGSANPERWAHQHLAQDGLDIQCAWYLRAVARTCPESMLAGTEFMFFVQEATPPYACSLVGLDRAFLEMGEEKVEHGLALWRECRGRDTWPGYQGRVHWISPTSWQMQRWEEVKLAEEFAS